LRSTFQSTAARSSASVRAAAAGSAFVPASRTYVSGTRRSKPFGAPSGRKRIVTSFTSPGRKIRTSHQYGA
jgi:hypothetical protein